MVERFFRNRAAYVAQKLGFNLKDPKKYVIPACIALLLVSVGSMAATKSIRDDINGASREPSESIEFLDADKDSLEFFHADGEVSSPSDTRSPSMSSYTGPAGQPVSFVKRNAEYSPSRPYRFKVKEIKGRNKIVHLSLSLEGESPPNIWPKKSPEEESPWIIYPGTLPPDDEYIFYPPFLPQLQPSIGNAAGDEPEMHATAPVPLPPAFGFMVVGLAGIYAVRKKSGYNRSFNERGL